MKVAEWIRDHPGLAATVSGDWSIEQVVDRLLDEPRRRDLWVVDANGRVVGCLSHRRLAEILLGEHRPTRGRRRILERVAGGAAVHLMESHFPFARPDEELDDVLNRQLRAGLEDMPVLDEAGTLLGTVNLTEVLREVRRRGSSDLS